MAVLSIAKALDVAKKGVIVKKGKVRGEHGQTGFNYSILVYVIKSILKSPTVGITYNDASTRLVINLDNRQNVVRVWKKGPRLYLDIYVRGTDQEFKKTIRIDGDLYYHYDEESKTLTLVAQDAVLTISEEYVSLPFMTAKPL